MPRNPGQAADIQRLNAFLCRSILQGFCPPDLTDIIDIFDAADEALIRKILHHPNHLLAPMLPSKDHTPCHLSPRRHNRQLISKINKLHCVQNKGATLFSTITLASLDGIFIIFIPFETGMNTPQSHVIYLINGLMTS